MFTLEVFFAFLLSTAVFAYVPGPAMLYATAQTLARGRTAGWMAALGLHIGGYVHVVAAALGLVVLFEAVPILYTSLKYLGAAYLIWLGLKMFFSGGEDVDAQVAVKHQTAARAFRESIAVEVLNPKTAIFYLAFLPQFTDPFSAVPLWLQLILLGTIVNVMFSSADVVCVLLADKVSATLRRSTSATKLLQRIGGSLLISLGITLALKRA